MKLNLNGGFMRYIFALLTCNTFKNYCILSYGFSSAMSFELFWQVSFYKIAKKFATPSNSIVSKKKTFRECSFLYTYIQQKDIICWFLSFLFFLQFHRFFLWTFNCDVRYLLSHLQSSSGAHQKSQIRSQTINNKWIWRPRRSRGCLKDASWRRNLISLGGWHSKWA